MTTTYHPETPTEVKTVLERVRKSGQRVKIHYGDAETGRDWLEEWHTTGRVGRSMGPTRVPLLVSNSRSLGGPSLLPHCVVKITATTGDHCVLYQHPQYHHAVMTFDQDGTVYADGAVHARFDTLAKMRRWLRAMNLNAQPV